MIETVHKSGLDMVGPLLQKQIGVVVVAAIADGAALTLRQRYFAFEVRERLNNPDSI